MRPRGMWAAVPVLLPQLLLAQTRKPTVAAAPRAPISTAAIASKAIPATVTIISIDAHGDTLGQGSGFLVRSTGAIITNWHVMRGASKAVVILASRERYDRVSFLDGNEATDIAIIKIPGYDLPTLPIRSTVPAVGEHIIAIGSPLGLSQTVSEGIVSATRMVDGRQLVQISAPISPGSSGGAVLDGEGRVFAISTSYLKGGQQLNFAVPVRYALGLLAANPTPRPLGAVFSATPQTSNVAGEAAARPAPTSTPVPILDGVFLLEETWHGPDFPSAPPFIGMIIAGDKVGWWEDAPVLRGGKLGQWTIYNVASFRTNSAGEVVLDMGSMVFDGFQTDSGGFYAVGRSPDRDTGNSLEVRARPIDVKLSEPAGLYTVSCRTQDWVDGDFGGAMDWNGEMAVIIANDSAYVDLFMENQSGGTTVLVGAGQLDANQSFTIVDQVTGGTTRLAGTIRAGVLTGSWEDRRTNGVTFSGTLRATRR